MRSLKDLAKVFRACEQCGTCTAACHLSLATDFNVRRLVRHVHLDLLDGGFLSTEPWRCSACGRCSALCVEGLDVTELVMALRSLARERGLEPDAVAPLVQAVVKDGSPFRAVGKTGKADWVRSGEGPVEGAETLFWVGCAPAYMLPGLARSCARVLTRLAGGYQLLASEPCCGEPLLALGRLDEARQTAEAVVEAVAASGARRLVTTCSGCYATFTRHYPDQLSLSLPDVEVLHLAELVDRERPALRSKKPLTLAYHDPCSLVRAADVHEEPRRILSSIENVTLVEGDRPAGHSVCCGGGGGVWALDNEAAVVSAANKLDREILPRDVDGLVTCCPVCHLNFRRTLRSRKSRVKVYDLVELVAACLQ